MSVCSLANLDEESFKQMSEQSARDRWRVIDRFMDWLIQADAPALAQQLEGGQAPHPRTKDADESKLNRESPRTAKDLRGLRQLHADLQQLFADDPPPPPLQFDLTGITISIIRSGDRERGLTTVYAGDSRKAFVLTVLRELRDYPEYSIARCAECRKFFVRFGKRKFCTGVCETASTRKRYREDPDRIEDHALLLWRGLYTRRHGNPPTRAESLAWLLRYRRKRVEVKRAAVSTRSADQVIPPS